MTTDETSLGSTKGKTKSNLWIALPWICIAVLAHYVKKYLENNNKGLPSYESVGSIDSEQLGCVPPSINEFPADIFTQEERQSGYVVFHITVTAYLCLILAIVCDHYFVPSLEIISNSLNLPADVAGATFMAIGTSSPELYSSLIGSFVTEGDIGLGTVVGSAVFNILGVTSVTGLLLWRTEAPVDWFPVSRDCLVYIFSVVTLICIIQDNVVTWFEASLLVVMFVMYIAVMLFNRDIKESCESKMEDLHLWWKHYRKARSNSLRLKTTRSRSLSKRPSNQSETEIINKNLPSLCLNDVPLSSCLESAVSTEQQGENDDSDSDDDMSPWTVPSESCGQVLKWIITWPALLLISSTIPNCRKPNEATYKYTFITSVVWIGIISYLCSWLVTIIGHTFGLPDSVAGITLLAAGISVPEVIASVIVVRNGMANMAMSNLIGSNIFDILFCLGVPWLVKTSFSGGKVIINSAALAYTTATLLSTVVLLFLTLGIAGWKLNWKVGLICLFLYAGFLTVACMYELNYFGDLNPPTCKS